ncbi:MAG: VCBS repeat-containing protein [Acidobacteriota bacterium]
MKKSFKKRITALLKGMWHIVVIILLLSLPTFSFFMPGFELSDLAIFGRNNADSSASGNTVLASMPGEGGTRNEFNRGAGFSRSGSESSSRGRITGGDQGNPLRSGTADGFGRTDRRGIISREGLNGTDRTSGEAGTQGEGDKVSADLLEAVLRDLESLDEAVKTLSSGYGSRDYPGSESSRYINPFLRSLANSAPEGDSGNGDSGGDSGGDTGGDTGGDSGGGTGGDSGGGSSGDDDQNIDPKERLYDALLIGSFQANQECKLLKASRGESDFKYYLEDGTAVDLFYRLIWNNPGVIVEFNQGELVLTSDYNGDGRDDLLVVSKKKHGDVVTCWARVLPNQIQEAFSGSFPYRTVSGLDFFDWNGDGVKELVVAFENTRNLFIYDVNNKTLRYSREFTMPFEPSAIVSTATLTPFKTSYLHVGSDSLDQNVLFNSRYPGVYSFMSPVTFRSSVTMKLDSAEMDGEALEFQAVEYNDRLIVLRKLNDYYLTVCSLGLRNSSPIASIVETGEGDNLKILLGF